MRRGAEKGPDVTGWVDSWTAIPPLVCMGPGADFATVKVIGASRRAKKRKEESIGCLRPELELVYCV